MDLGCVTKPHCTVHNSIAHSASGQPQCQQARPQHDLSPGRRPASAALAVTHMLIASHVTKDTKCCRLRAALSGTILLGAALLGTALP